MRSRGAFWGTVGQAAEQTPEGSKQTRLLTVPGWYFGPAVSATPSHDGALITCTLELSREIPLTLLPSRGCRRRERAARQSGNAPARVVTCLHASGVSALSLTVGVPARVVWP